MKKMTARDIRALKGKRQISKLSVLSTEHAAAAEEAGIDMLSTTFDKRLFPAMRSAAPTPFFVTGVPFGTNAGAEDELRAAFMTKSAGADGFYTAMRLEVVELLAKEAIPVIGHVGLVPSKKTWTGGLNPVGKTADEALALFKRVKAYESAGAFALEIELVPERIASEIARRTSLILLSMGSGEHCDGQFLFAIDVLGETEGHVPRHAKVYRDFRAEHARMHAERVAAFAEYRNDIAAGDYPAEGHKVRIDDVQFERFVDQLDSIP